MSVDDARAHVHNLGERAVTSEGVLVVDMPIAAQAHRVYDAFSMVGPRNRIDKITKRLSLLP